MSRLKNFSRNLATSYLQLGVNVVYSLVSIPLILHWLPKAEFGMWAVLVQMMAYVSIIDLGMTAAVARLLVDYKDRRSDGGYGSLIKTAFLVSLTQAMIILAVVTLGAPMLADLIKIPPEHQATFIALIRMQGVFAAFSFSLRPLGLMLYAHQRMDLQSYTDIFNLVAQLGLLVLFLMQDCGIYSFIYANACTLLIGPAFLFWNCRRLGCLPQAAEWGKASWKLFMEVFNYGKDVFLMNLGSQLIMASQTIVVSRVLGMEQAAIWSVGTKMFNLVVPLMCRPFGASIPGLNEIFARGETQRFKARFKNIVVLTASTGAFLGVSFALCNHLFVEFWTGGEITWSAWTDILLGVWIFLLSMQTTHSNLVPITKQIGGMRYVFFIEGICFVLLATLLGSRWGLAGVVGTSIICTCFFSYQYSLRRSRSFFNVSLFELAFIWLRPCWNLAVVYGGIALLISFLDYSIPPLWRLGIHASVAGCIGGYLLLRIGLPPEMIQEAIAQLPKPVAKYVQLACAR